MVGGWNRKIYYAMSKDMCDNKMNNIWQLSNILLPCDLSHCKCLITHQSTNNPKLLILGGISNYSLQNTFLEHDICDIVGKDTFNRFILNFTKVYYA